ncbi:hypothetical protein GYMLUDRAFT_252448 [Collybiopsis luxurians FD-317 M1]|uniref:Uncharacterized protein n=1 Tax=Collybiopsis luxurians FD-317 M1 TaxID=944289 RepID=A0A0D0BNH1_9AGAR|nr:hypothetical protein GYMLUDRAFT_252448 [Collybiopsis luxurians FD-317 M1]
MTMTVPPTQSPSHPDPESSSRINEFQLESASKQHRKCSRQGQKNVFILDQANEDDEDNEDNEDELGSTLIGTSSFLHFPNLEEEDLEELNEEQFCEHLSKEFAGQGKLESKLAADDPQPSTLQRPLRMTQGQDGFWRPSDFEDIISRVKNLHSLALPASSVPPVNHSAVSPQPPAASPGVPSPPISSSSTSTAAPTHPPYCQAQELPLEVEEVEPALQELYRQLQQALYNSPGPNFMQKYSVFHVKCHKGFEQSIISWICKNIVNNDTPLLEPLSPPSASTLEHMIVTAFCSKQKGFVYLMYLNMSPQNTCLAMYLCGVNGFFYPHLPMVIAPALAMCPAPAGPRRALVPPLTSYSQYMYWQMTFHL